jgi:hypothetical protein
MFANVLHSDRFVRALVRRVTEASTARGDRFVSLHPSRAGDPALTSRRNLPVWSGRQPDGPQRAGLRPGGYAGLSLLFLSASGEETGVWRLQYIQEWLEGQDSGCLEAPKSPFREEARKRLLEAA